MDAGYTPPLNNTFYPNKADQEEGKWWQVSKTKASIIAVATGIFVGVAAFFGLLALTGNVGLAVAVGILGGLAVAGITYLCIPTRDNDGDGNDTSKTARKANNKSTETFNPNSHRDLLRQQEERKLQVREFQQQERLKLEKERTETAEIMKRLQEMDLDKQRRIREEEEEYKVKREQLEKEIKEAPLLVQRAQEHLNTLPPNCDEETRTIAELELMEAKRQAYNLGLLVSNLESTHKTTMALLGKK